MQPCTAACGPPVSCSSDHLEQMTQPQRRELHNRARTENGLETIEDVEAHARFVAVNEMARRRAAARPTPACAVCGRPPTGPGGMPGEVPPARKWHCPEHEHLAEAGDMEAPLFPIDFATMTPIDPDEIAREQREDERRREEDRRRAEERELGGREAREVARLRDEQFRGELFGGRW
jgi:hypothetical protein